MEDIANLEANREAAKQCCGRILVTGTDKGDGIYHVRTDRVGDFDLINGKISYETTFEDKIVYWNRNNFVVASKAGGLTPLARSHVDDR